MLVILVALSINTRSVTGGIVHGASAISKPNLHPPQLDEEGRAVIRALSRAVPVIFLVIGAVLRIGEVSSWTC